MERLTQDQEVALRVSFVVVFAAFANFLVFNLHRLPFNFQLGLCLVLDLYVFYQAVQYTLQNYFKQDPYQ